MFKQTKKQRVIDAIKHKQTEITPWQINLTSAFLKNAESQLGADADEFLGNHLFMQKYKNNIKLPGGRENDIFGVTWTKLPDDDIGVVTGFPLKDKPLNAYSFPKIQKDFAMGLCKNLEADKTERFRMFALTMLYFERAWSLRGMEDLLVDMCLNPSFTYSLFESIQNHHLELLDLVLEYDFEAVYFGDDWGQQSGLIMGPDMWRKFIKPGMAKLFDKVKSAGKYVVLHSCGDLREIMGDLVNMGLDVYNTVQPEIYDLKMLKREYGDALSFYGGISTQQFLPFASTAECTKLAIETLKIMGKTGGYIFSPTHSVTADIPVENVLALVKAVNAYHWE
jgi:uroporphyrinogen decarboxylase